MEATIRDGKVMCKMGDEFVTLRSLAERRMKATARNLTFYEEKIEDGQAFCKFTQDWPWLPASKLINLVAKAERKVKN